QVVFNFFPLYNDAVQAELFKLQQVLANFLIDQLENKEISIKRAAEIAKQALSIIPDEENPNIKLDEIEQQLITIPELSKLDFKLILK
ncbi:hypothetical protein KBB59_02820, partial [Candidatus Woesebacteria bacterium]|nr:hypothetical protein [Candidatus Woesebacteria bacterium]